MPVHGDHLKAAALVLPVDTAQLSQLRGWIGPRPVWLAASTHPGEEEIVANAHHNIATAHPGLLTVAVPRLKSSTKSFWYGAPLFPPPP